MSNEQAFKPGDEVMIKTGGAPMTVSKVEGDEVHVTWMDGTKLMNEVLVRHVLKRASTAQERVAARLPFTVR